MKSGEWVKREKSFFKAHLPHKGLTYNNTSMSTSNLAGEGLSDTEKLSKANVGSVL